MGAYTDCYVTEVATGVRQAAYVEAFYTGALFKLERFLLSHLASLPSTDAQAADLASGTTGVFAAWRVEERTEDQLLMCDLRGRTRSWLMVVPGAEPCVSTRLYFGSAVVPVINKSGQATLGFTVKALLGFHRLYSRALLSAAGSRLGHRHRADSSSAANPMPRAAFSIQLFAAYLFVLGAVFVIAPNLLLSVFRIPSAEGWVRIVGLLAFNIGAYGWVAARNQYRAFFVASVWLRVEVWLVLTALAVLGLVPAVLALFGIADLLGGIWTFWCLRLDERVHNLPNKPAPRHLAPA